MAFSTLFLDASSGSGTMDGIKDMVSDLSQTIGVDLFEEDIDNVVFKQTSFYATAILSVRKVLFGGFCR